MAKRGICCSLVPTFIHWGVICSYVGISWATCTAFDVLYHSWLTALGYPQCPWHLLRPRPAAEFDLATFIETLLWPHLVPFGFSLVSFFSRTTVIFRLKLRHPMQVTNQRNGLTSGGKACSNSESLRFGASFMPQNWHQIPVVLRKAVAENYGRCWLLWATDGRAKTLMNWQVFQVSSLSVSFLAVTI